MLWLRSSTDEADPASSHGVEFAPPGLRGYARRMKGFFQSDVILGAGGEVGRMGEEKAGLGWTCVHCYI